MPPRYRLQLRPKFKSAGAFDPADHNDSGLFPGWDYSPAMPNAFAPPVLLLFYFIPEMRSAVLAAQYNEKLFSARGYEKALAPELGFIFHHIESLSRFGLLHPVKPSADSLQPRIGVWAPSNFLTALGTMPEAEQLQILDGSPAAVDPPRRPEAFYRFLAYQLDKELSKNSGTKRMDSLHGLDFISLNQFIIGSSPPSQSTTRALTVDLNYDLFSREAEKKPVRFGELLRHSLCRETRLRAWNQSSKAYETIVQRKIATSLPQILTLSCACAGRKKEDGLWVWRTDDGEPWLPEVVEIELLEDGNVLVRELVKCNDEGKETWSTFKGKSSLPPTVSKLVSEVSSKEKYRYRLDAVLSFVSDDVESVGDDEHPGHHVLHARVPHQYKKRVLRSQQEEAGKLALRKPDASKLVMTASVKSEVFRKRSEHAGKRLSAANDECKSGWVLYNGFAVSNTVVEDARAFHVPFKEPCLVVFRALEGDPKGKSDETEKKNDRPSPRIPAQVMNARSLSSTSSRTSHNFNPNTIEDGKLIAFDAEFVSVQDEEATLNESGLKMILRETRHAVGRISVIDCSTRQIILDDHVLPRERVVDYLTRFSGIVAEDLDPSKTPHSLISTRSGYLKLRYLMEQGCIFVGHGLRQDFATVNLIVPPNQILDTVEIFHQPGMRYISLRFLANCVLGRDMQQDIHDSVEDALAAFELYEKALEWKQQGVFDKKLQEIYTHGKKTDWKLGLE
jgi:PAB-dependent poly(A)-specific ribonuclease subunit 2